MLLKTQDKNRNKPKPRKRKKKLYITYPSVTIPTLPPTVGEPDMSTSIIFYSFYTHISPGATMGQGRPVFPDTHRIEQPVPAPEIDTITDKYTHQVFPLEYTLRLLRVAANYSRSPSEDSSGSKVGVSGRIKAAFDAAKAFAGAETEVGVDYEQSVGAVVKYSTMRKGFRTFPLKLRAFKASIKN